MATGTYRDTVRIRGLQPFLWTQFLGAFNDNVFKMVVALSLADRLVPYVGAAFILPFLIFSGYAGALADTFSKRRVLVSMKVFEIAAMALAIPALMLGRFDLQLGILFLMGTQATFFSPAKYGIVPELLADEHLSRANGLLEMSTFVAIVLGTALGGPLLAAWPGHRGYIGVGLVAVAMAGTAMSLRIPRVPAARPNARVPRSPIGTLGRDLKHAYADRVLWTTMMGISYFWFLGAFLQLALITFGHRALHAPDATITWLATALSIGIGAGSLLAGRLSGDKVELGLVPMGAIGMGGFSLLLAAAAPSFSLACVALVFLGISGGLFAVPLNALLQQRASAEEKGRVLAVNNILNTIGIILASVVLELLLMAGLSISTIIAIAGVVTLLSSVYVLLKVPDYFVRFTLWWLTHTVYRIRILGRPNLPVRGPALLVCNHLSHIDGALVGACVQRFVRFIVWKPMYDKPGIHWLMRRMHAIPIDTSSRRHAAEAIERARQELADGHVVCIFAEGAISRTGNLLPFKRGFEHIVAGSDAPIIPVFLDRVWGSVFSFKRGRFFWKLPERLPYPVTVAFGAPMPSTATAPAVRRAVMELGADAARERRPHTDLLHTEFMRTAKRGGRLAAVADSTQQRLARRATLVASLALGRLLRRRCRHEAMVGIVMPASVGGALANVATQIAGKVAVNLNFTAGPEAMAAATDQCEVRTILTSRRFLEKAGLAADPRMVFLEDLRREIRLGDKLIAWAQAHLAPARLLARWHRHGRTGDSLAAVIFSSGSTGIPKGVMLSHRNVLANVDALAQIFPVTPADRLIGVLPFFHSFGFTGTLWFPLIAGIGVAYHPNPMDAKMIGELAATHGATMLISTPTFCHAYTRRCTPEQFAHLRYAIVGAEKLRDAIASAFLERFGVPLLEGYGCTEMAPVVAVNTLEVVSDGLRQTGIRAGSVGQPIPGVAVKIIDRETNADLAAGEDGLILVKGPNLMQGYLHQESRTAEVIRDGWYITGDIGHLDEDGFLFVTDRVSRFSKIGGEMVPHQKVEETINAILGDPASIVVSMPDEAKGERLVAFYTRADVTPDALWERLCQTELPRLWLPRRDSLFVIDEIPTLGTGKVDLRRVRDLAQARGQGQK